MATTTPHDRAEAHVPVGAIPAPRTTPRGPAPAAVALLTPPPAVTSPPAVPGTVPQQRPWAAAPVSAEPVELAPVAPFRTGRAPFAFLPPRTTRARPAAAMTTPADQR